MKNSILTLFLFLTYGLHAQIPSQPQMKPTKVESAPNDTIITKDATDPSKEYMVVKTPKGLLQARGELVNGKKNGVWREYTRAGVLVKVDEYRMGVRQGASVNMATGGLVIMDANYVNDTLDGQKTVYQASGRIKYIENYSMGILHGMKKTFYDDASPMEESYYKRGVRDSTCRWYLQNGKLSVEYNYSNGLLEGSAKEFDKEGRISREGRYKNNNEEGEWKEYKDSVLVKKIVYKNGVNVKEVPAKK